MRSGNRGTLLGACAHLGTAYLCAVDDWKQGLARQIFASREIEKKVSEHSTGSICRQLTRGNHTGENTGDSGQQIAELRVAARDAEPA